jgi:zinc transport system substrate-binding protein
MKNKTLGIFLLFTLLIPLTISSLSTFALAQEDPLKVAVSIMPQTEWVEEIGGEHIDVQALIPAGQSPASFAPTSTELTFIADAEVWFAIGLLPFDKAHKAAVLDAAESPSFQFVNLSIGLELLEVEGHDHDHEEEGEEENGYTIDPHTWLSPTRAIQMVETIRDTLKSIDPTNAGDYDTNAASYIGKLTALNTTIATKMASVNNTHMLVFHPAWGYFAHDFGLTLVALEEEGQDPTSEHFAEVIDLAREENVGAIFIQEEFSITVAQAFAVEACVELIQLKPLAPDYIDNLNDTADLLQEKLDQAPFCAVDTSLLFAGALIAVSLIAIASIAYIFIKRE